MSDLPYNPTVALKSSLHEELVYILQTKGGSSYFTLVSVNASSSLSASDLSSTTISNPVPFAGEDGKSFTALISPQDDIYAFAGDCLEGADGAGLWSLSPHGLSTGAGWKEVDITVQGVSDSDTASGANYLANGMAFSGTVGGSTDIYVFGGMCPNSSTQTVDSWQASASYSNSMLELDAKSNAQGSYDLKELYSRGPPIPEAGFSVTPLTPTFSNTSGGDTSRQQNFVLLGGQTQTAFINMSQAALFSLPQQSWSFIPINEPSSSANTELAVRATDSVDPRSGHTAVLSDDGSKIIVYGGWVGDVSSPADPQLAVLQVGSDYGGSGDWQWSIPKQTGTPPSGAGLYGHGAVMLSGDVLMITGGYTIPQSSSKLLKLFKRQSPAANTNSHFFNITSNSWTADYTNPLRASRTNPSSNHSSNKGKKIGLGVGLGIGLFLLLLLILLALFLFRRHKHRTRSINEKDLRGLSLGDQRTFSPALGYTGADQDQDADQAHRAHSPDFYPWAPPPDVQPSHLRSAERAGLLNEVPSPTRGMRTRLHSRPNYSYDEGRRSRASNSIHPIDEREEYEPIPLHTDGDLGNRDSVHGEPDIVSSAPILDPFRDPPGRERHLLDGSRTPSPVSPARAPTQRHARNSHSREQEMASWESDWALAASIPLPRSSSPDKSDRTSSTLSNQSTGSMVSALSYQNHDAQSVSGLSGISNITRSISQRSAALFSSRPLSSHLTSGPGSAVPERFPSEPVPSAVAIGKRPATLHITRGHRSGEGQAWLQSQTRDRTHTQTQPQTSFPQLQSEGQALLGGSPFETQPSSPSKQPRPKTWGVFGSMRRALTGAGSSSSHNSPPELRRKPVGGSSAVPQRSSSAGANSILFRRQQGARDWDVQGQHFDSGRMSGLSGGRSSPGQESFGSEDWDVEGAVESRVVQLMFTVPKEKLRVVNASPDGDGVSVVSVEGSIGVVSPEGGSDGSGSLKSGQSLKGGERSPGGEGSGGASEAIRLGSGRSIRGQGDTRVKQRVDGFETLSREGSGSGRGKGKGRAED